MAVSSLPVEVEVDIFLRLPMDSILACRCVCKVWRKLLRSHNFTKSHLLHGIRNPKLMLKTYDTERVETKYDYTQIHNCQFFSLDYASISPALPKSSTFDLQIPKGYGFEDIECSSVRMLGSCNGLICMSLELPGGMHICIWNPTIGEYEYRNTPLPSRDFLTRGAPDCYSLGHVFYYDSVADNYKLVRIAGRKRYRDFQVDVHTLGSKSWTRSESAGNYRLPRRRDIPAFFMNGALHWIGYWITGCNNNKEVISPVIVSFDVSNERFVDFLFPEEVQINDHVLWIHQCVAGVLENCLCLSNCYKYKRIDIWVMEDYGVRESWTKRYSFRTSEVVVFEDWKLLWSFTNGELLIDTGVSKLIYYPKIDKYRVLAHDNNEIEFSVPLNYVESLISPDTVGINY